ncbi:MAG: hypothetical protein IJ735_07725 [Clostridia bacterium]|nr:hypothetical protein [Clostridia bacterium]
MPIKHSLSILVCNFKLVAKIFVFFLVILLVVGGLTIGVMKPIFDGFFTELQTNVPITAEEFFNHPILSMQKYVDMFGDYLTGNEHFGLQLFYLWLIIVVTGFLLRLPLLPVSKILHGKTTSGFDMGLLNAVVSTIGQNLLYSAVSALVLGTVDVGILVGCGYLAVALTKAIGLIALPIVALLVFILYAARMSLFCHWLPEICAQEKKNVFRAFATSLRPTGKRFVKDFICLFVLIIAGWSLAILTALPTFGAATLLIVPTLFTLYSAMCLCLNYSYKQQKYFIDNGVTVYNPVKKFETANETPDEQQ